MKPTIGILLLLGGSALADTPAVLAIRNARVVTVSGPVIPKGTVVVRDGLIEAVGANVTPPADAWVVEGEGLTVYPGLIDALSTLGIPPAAPAGGGAGGRGAITPTPGPAPITLATASAAPRPADNRPNNQSWVRAADLVQPTDRRLAAARNAGFTSAITFPGAGRIIAGQGVVINLAGESTGKMIVSGPSGMYLSMGGRGGFGTSFPGSLMGVIAYVRQTYLDADHYREAKDLYARNPRGARRPEYDRALEGVLEARSVLLPASSAVDIDRMLRFAKELNRSAILYEGHEAYRTTDLLKKSGVPMLVSLQWPEKERDTDPEQADSLRTLELRDKAPTTPGVLAKAGVRFALYSGGMERPADTVRAVRRAIDAGLKPEDAVRALTLGPAEIFSVADRLGSIETGKIANLIVTDGDLFQEKTRVKHVFVDGVKFDPAPEAAPAFGEGGPRP